MERIELSLAAIQAMDDQDRRSETIKSQENK